MDNRQNILARALELFAAHGYDAVGVQEIANASAVAKPTLYHYFGSKLGLLQSLFEEYYQPLNDQIAQAAQYQGDLPFTLRKIAQSYFYYASQYPTYYRLQLALWFAPRHSDAYHLVSAWNERQHHIIEEMFIQATKDHGNMRGRQKFYAASLIGIIHTCIGLALNDYLILDDEMIQRSIHQFEHGIYS